MSFMVHHAYNKKVGPVGRVDYGDKLRFALTMFPDFERSASSESRPVQRVELLCSILGIEEGWRSTEYPLGARKVSHQGLTETIPRSV